MKAFLTLFAAIILHYHFTWAKEDKRDITPLLDTAIVQKIPFNNDGSFQIIKHSKVRKLLKNDQIQILKALTHDTLDLRVIRLLTENTVHYHLLVRNNVKESFRMFDLNFSFNDTFLDSITVAQFPNNQLFVLHMEKHHRWSSDYKKGTSFHTGKMILFIDNNQLYRKYFKEYEELEEVDFRTGTHKESLQYQIVSLTRGQLSISFPDRTPPTQLMYRLDQKSLILAQEIIGINSK